MDLYCSSILTVNQIYLGYDVDDLLRLVRYRGDVTDLTSDTYTDYFGIKTRTSYFFDQQSSDTPPENHVEVKAGFPFPDDGLHAEAIEYLGTCKALEAAGGSDVTIVELGAGYAPWLVFSAHVARRLGIKKIRLVAVEAEAERLALIKSHFEDNDIPLPGCDDSVTTRVIHAAISDTKGSVTFGSAGIRDWGGAVQTTSDVDYRGMNVRQATVPALPIRDVLQDLPVVDLLHVDIQGWEARAIRASLDEICASVRYMVIGTHSRAIEGDLLAMLRERGWKLMHEKPCQFHCHVDTEELAGATYVDGTQVWANRALGVQTNPPMALNAEDTRIAEQTRQFLQTGQVAEPVDPESATTTSRDLTGQRVADRLRKLLAFIRD